MGRPTEDEVHAMEQTDLQRASLEEHYFRFPEGKEVWSTSRGLNVGAVNWHCQHCSEVLRNPTNDELSKHLLEQHNIDPFLPR